MQAISLIYFQLTIFCGYRLSAHHDLYFKPFSRVLLNELAQISAGVSDMTHAFKNAQGYGVHPPQIGTWKRTGIENMATAFTRKGSAPEPVNAADADKLHSINPQSIAQQRLERGARAQTGKKHSQHKICP
ncbi:MAG: hypothetical protein ABJN72_06565 [Sulfitobacter sp.]